MYQANKPYTPFHTPTSNKKKAVTFGILLSHNTIIYTVGMNLSLLEVLIVANITHNKSHDVHNLLLRNTLTLRALYQMYQAHEVVLSSI